MSHQHKFTTPLLWIIAWCLAVIAMTEADNSSRPSDDLARSSSVNRECHWYAVGGSYSDATYSIVCDPVKP